MYYTINRLSSRLKAYFIKKLLKEITLNLTAFHHSLDPGQRLTTRERY